MKTIKASVFKAQCLHLMDEVHETGEEIVITKHGNPISKLVPYRKKPTSLYGLHRGKVTCRDDLIEPLGEAWEAES